jgi:type VI secretion system protein ImpH
VTQPGDIDTGRPDWPASTDIPGVAAAAAGPAADPAHTDAAPDEASRGAVRRDPLVDVAAAPHRYDFQRVMRMVDAHHADKPRLGTARRPVDEPVRLGQTAELAFASSSLSAVDLQDRSGKPRIEVRFFGLFGPNGPLPLHLTAYARERRLHKGDETFARFADLFHHRLLLLFYRAWAQAQPTVSFDRPAEDRFADYVGSLIGAGGAAWRQRDAAPDHARLAFAGLLSRQARNADGLAHLLSGYLGMQVRVEQFVGRWMPLPAAERSRIGRRAASRRMSTSQLGASAVLGQAVFDRQHHFRVHIGPLTLPAFEALLPVGSALPALQALLKQYVGLEYGWDLRLELDKTQVPACRPGRYGRLGWTTWLGSPPGDRPAALNLVPNPQQS